MPWLAFGDPCGTLSPGALLQHQPEVFQMAETATLPDDGDVIEFEKVPAGSLIPPPFVTPEGSKPLPRRRYRVERKPLDQEYLLVDTVSGHASRVPAHEFKRATWAAVSHETLDAEAKARIEAVKPAEVSDAKLLSVDPPRNTTDEAGILNLQPLPPT
jgi:hypothetical protein